MSGNLLFKQISVSDEITCGIDTADIAWCWGEWLVMNLLQFARSSTSTAGQLCLPLQRSSLLCAGGVDFFYSAMLGEGSDTPTKVSDDLRFKQISAGLYHICGIDTAGSAWCWGECRLYTHCCCVSPVGSWHAQNEVH